MTQIAEFTQVRQELQQEYAEKLAIVEAAEQAEKQQSNYAKQLSKAAQERAAREVEQAACQAAQQEYNERMTSYLHELHTEIAAQRAEYQRAIELVQQAPQWQQTSQQRLVALVTGYASGSYHFRRAESSDAEHRLAIQNFIMEQTQNFENSWVLVVDDRKLRLAHFYGAPLTSQRGDLRATALANGWQRPSEAAPATVALDQPADQPPDGS